MKNLVPAICIGLALCLVGAGFAVAPLYVPGLALLLLAGVALVWVHAGTGRAAVRRRLGATEVEERAALSVFVGYTRARVPLPGAELRPWPEADPRRPGARSGAVQAVASFPRRGRHRLGPASLRITDPLGLCQRTILSPPDEVLVLPRIEPVQEVDLEGEPDLLGHQATVPVEAGATEVDSLRPHRPGAPASRIHWPTVARTATLVERRLVADGDEAPAVVLDPRAPASPEALDRAVRAAASLCVHLAGRGGCGLLLPGDRRPTRIDPDLRAFALVHARLAEIGPLTGGPATGAVTGSSVVVWVSAAPGATSRIRGLPVAVAYLVSPEPESGLPVRFTVAGCSGQRLEPARSVSAA